jgi:RNA polymerase sigma-70 factor (ECF subfamily)
MNEIDDLTIARAKKKDNDAYKRLYDYYAQFVWKIAFRTLHGDARAASEVVQETFVRVYYNLSKFKGGSGFSTWVFRIAFNACMSLIKKTPRYSELDTVENEAIAANDEAEKLDMKRKAERILSSLSEEDRFLLTGREILGLSFEELADISGKNQGALRTQLSRLKQDIRSKYGPL